MGTRLGRLAVVIGFAAMAALLLATRPAEPEFAVASRLLVYGDAPSEFGRLWVPTLDDDHPVVVLVHGGFWRVSFDSEWMEPLAVDLAQRGYAVWNIEYGRTGEGQGGWPDTFEHVGSAIDQLEVFAPDFGLDVARVAVVGHSAGGHLALWAGGRDALPVDAPGADPKVVPVVVVGLAPVVDLTAAAIDGLGRSAVVELLDGDPDEHAGRYALATPRNGIAEAIVVVGGQDDVVPPRYSTRAGFAAETVSVAGADHFDLIDPTDPSWDQVVELLRRSIGSLRG